MNNTAPVRIRLGTLSRLAPAWLLVLAVGCGTSSTSPPSEFPFLDQEGPAAEALQALYADAQRAPRTQADADAWLGRRIGALAALAANRAEAQALLLEALSPLTIEDHSRLVALKALLEQLGDSPAILAKLHGLAMGPLTPDESTPSGHDMAPEAELGRSLCMALLAHHAREGNAEAQALALQAAGSPSRPVRAAAVQVTLAVSRDRRLAQRALGAELPAGERYLLYLY